MSKQRYNGFYLSESYVSSSPKPEQIASQILQIYSFKNHFWRSVDEQYLVPAGESHQIFSVDLGAMLSDIIETVDSEERHKSHRKYPQEENLKGSRKFRLPKSSRYLEQYITSKFRIQEDNISYSFDLRKEAITLKQPLEFHVTEYLAENKKIVEISREKVLVWAKKWKNSNIPAGDFDLRYLNNTLFLNKSYFSS